MKIRYFICLTLILFTSRIYSEDLSKLSLDLENYWLLGRRAISLGHDYYVNARGAFCYTGAQSDFAISGKGFFTLYNENTREILLTRNGSFTINFLGYLVNRNGWYVLKDTSEIENSKFDYIKLEDILGNDKAENVRIESFEEYFSNLSVSKPTYPFLIMVPENNEDIVYEDSEYIKSDNNIVERTNDISNGVLESMPINLNMIAEQAIKILQGENSTNENERAYVIELIRRRYSEMKEFYTADDNYLEELEKLIFELELLVIS